MGFDKLRCKFRNQIRAWSKFAPIDREVLALDEAKSPKFIEHREPIRRIAWISGQAAEVICSACLLRSRPKRPRDRRAAKKGDEFAPPHVPLQNTLVQRPRYR